MKAPGNTILITIALAATVVAIMIPGSAAAGADPTNATLPDDAPAHSGGPKMTLIVLEDTEARSKVAGAEIYIDGAYAGETDAAEGKFVAPPGPGEHRVTVARKGLANTSALMAFVPGGNYTFLLSTTAKKYSIFDANVFFDALRKELAYGAVNTISLSVVSTAFGLAIGLAMGMGRVSANPLARNVSAVYVEVIRGVPLLLLLLFIKYGLPFLILDTLGFGLALDAFAACVIAISMNCGAYMGEIFKAGINAIQKGQMEAARSLGMSYGQSMRHIILPQAFKIVLPALGNEFISVIKGSSISLVIAYPEIVWWSNSIRSETYNTFMPLLAAGIIYLCMTIPLSRCIRYAETRLGLADAKEPRAGLFGKKRRPSGGIEGPP